MARLYLLFLCSGISGLIYQVVWVRGLGNAFGNTMHSAALVVAIFMLGLGVGSYALGAWADRRHRQRPQSLLHVYGVMEAAIAACGLVVTLLLPHLSSIVASLSSYTAADNGWHVLTLGSYLARALFAVLLLGPVTVLMGGTLTVLIRFLVRTNLAVSGSTIAWLYAVNTAGAAAGAFLTDFVLAPLVGLRGTGLIAVALNVVAGLGAMLLARGAAFALPAERAEAASPARRERPSSKAVATDAGVAPVRWTALALALSGFASLGMEMLWLRHFAMTLGGFRAVFSLLLTVVLVGIGIGAVLGGWLLRRVGRAAESLMLVQALFVVAVFVGVTTVDANALAAVDGTLGAGLRDMGPLARWSTEVWYNLRPMLLEAGLPSLLAGFSFPLANAIVQRVEAAVGRRAGLLYFANTAGAVCGSLVTGYFLLSQFGVQTATTALAAVAALAIIPLALTGVRRVTTVAAGGVVVVAFVGWLMLPADFVLRRAVVPQRAGERVVTVSEGATELIEVLEDARLGRALITNGHAMASTAPLDQRYMRALAHIPLLSMPAPRNVLVIGFGVGNSTHAATLHPSVEHVDVADLSRHILEHASYFSDANHDVLSNPKVSVYVNDGRQHLEMTEPGHYDLITLEPPPIAYAGVSSLYSREFYALARSRLTPGGYIGQWLPAYQVPVASSVAMVRAFLDQFPQAVMLSGTKAELLLIGTTGPHAEIDPLRVRDLLAAAPAVREDLERIDLGTPREIIGTFVGSARTMEEATRGAPPTTDDWPFQEYGVVSRLSNARLGVSSAFFDLDAVASWCPRCEEVQATTSALPNLDLYLALMREAYVADQAAVEALAVSQPGRQVLGSRYLGKVVPDTPEVRRVISAAWLRTGSGLIDSGRFADAVEPLRQAIALAPNSAEAHNDLGVALGQQGKVAEAAESFRRALELQPDFAEAKDNLVAATARR